MLKQTRVSKSVDVNRLSNALSRPGIDPRVWVSQAVVETVVVDNEGVFCDVTLVPSGVQETARLGTVYAGPNFGQHYPIEVNDEVTVLAPSGDPDEGLIILPRMHSASDPLPQEVKDNPTDVVLRVKPGRSVRVIVDGGGLVHLGSEVGAEFVALAEKVLSELQSIKTSHDTHVHSGGTILGLTGTPTVSMPSPESVAADKVKAT